MKIVENRKNYNRIGHLPGSKLGESESVVSESIVETLTKTGRNRKGESYRIIVQEKLDGSNVGVLYLNDKLYAITRSGHLASTSKYEQHNLFHRFVVHNEDRFRAVLSEGEKLCGEWLAQAHGTIYILEHEPFVAFDVFDKTGVQLPYKEMLIRAAHGRFTTPVRLNDGHYPMTVFQAEYSLGIYGRHNAYDLAEGAVWRAEKKDKVCHMAKYVRSKKIPGYYFPGMGNVDKELWLWHPDKSKISPLARPQE